MSEKQVKWYEVKGEESDVVISCRVRLARNLKKYPFSVKLQPEQAIKLVEEIGVCAKLLQEQMPAGSEEEKEYLFCPFQALTEVDKQALVERHVVSPAFAGKKQATGLILSEDESLGVMINEEDHIRIQAISGGMNMAEVWERANRADDILDQALSFAYDRQYGYLTSCPTNVGTGLRASYMMFLPALTSANRIAQLAEEMSAYGIVLRGIYGEGSSAIGDIYQVSNQRTLGNSEQEIMENLNHVVRQVIRQERRRREFMLEKHYDELEDQVHRSYGVLKYATKIPSSDAITLLGQLKLGVDSGLIRMKEEFPFYQLVIAVQRANIQMQIGRGCGNLQRDKYRAEYIRQNLPELAG